MIGYILGGSILLMVVIVAVFVNVSPQMGGKHSQEDKIRYQESGHYVDGKFMNLVETTMDFTFSSSIDLMKAYIKVILSPSRITIYPFWIQIPQKLQRIVLKG